MTPTVMPDIFYRASVLGTFRMDPRPCQWLQGQAQPLAGMTTGKIRQFRKPCLLLRKTGTPLLIGVGKYATFHRTGSFLKPPNSCSSDDVPTLAFSLSTSCTSYPSLTSPLFSIGYEHLSLSSLPCLSQLLKKPACLA